METPPQEVLDLISTERYMEAIPLMERWVAENPTSANLTRLAELCQNAGVDGAAANYFLQALKLGEEDPGNWSRLVRQLLFVGDLDACLNFCQLGLNRHPQNQALLGVIHDLFMKLDFTDPPQELSSLLEDLLTGLATRPQIFYPFAASAIDHRLADWEAGMNEISLKEAAENGLLRGILDHCLIQSAQLESYILAARQYICRNFDSLCHNQPPWLEGFILSLANQCLTAEYVFSLGAPDEILTVEAICAALDPNKPDYWSRIGLLACYKPIFGELSEQRIQEGGDNPGGGVERLDFIRRHWQEPLEERVIAESLPSLSSLQDPISIQVNLQYENAPYPRWRHAAKPQPRSLREDLRQQLPSCPESLLPALDLQAPEILIAGCGTGQHSALSALSNPSAHITAIDLSRRSLAYAKRKGDELGIENISYLQADILELDSLDQQFDVIESMGVLHHMAAPFIGWQNLCEKLKPGGFMKVGLYSRLARARLEDAQKIAAATGGETTLQRIRSFRDKVKWAPDFPFDIRKELIAAYDFYSLGGCHDLLFHVQERSYDLPEIQDCLRSLNLDFLGFQLSHPNIWHLYNREFPDDPAQESMENWAELERHYPGIFSNMYAFWVKKGIQKP